MFVSYQLKILPQTHDCSQWINSWQQTGQIASSLMLYAVTSPYMLIHSSVPFPRSSLWRTSPVQPWWRWETIMPQTVQSPISTTPFFFHRELICGEHCAYMTDWWKWLYDVMQFRPATHPFLQCIQAACHSPRLLLWAGGRHRQLQGLPQLQEQSLHVPKRGG